MLLIHNASRSLRPYVRRLIPARSMTILSKQSGEEYKKENYSARIKLTGRPVSPHVTIYSFPITALSSITIRVTGVALSSGCFGPGALELVGGGGTAANVMEIIGDSGSLVSSSAKFCVAFPCIYHYLGAVRHYAWDKYPERFLTTEQTKQTSYALMGSSVLLSGIMLFL